MTTPAVNIRTLVIALLAACAAFQLNASMLSPALETMAAELNTDDAAVGMSQTAFFASAGLFATFVPRLSDIKGRRRTLVVMLALVAAGSAVGALAPSIEVMYLARIVQGCSGPVIAICLLMLRAEVADRRRYGTLMGVVTAFNGGVAGIDALAGGFLAAHFGFRSLFWTMAVVALLATISVAIGTRESRPSEGTRMDWIGVACLATAMASLLVALDEAGKLSDARWGLVVGLLALAFAAFAAFCVVEGKVAQPLVKPAQLADRGTWAVLLTTTLTLTGLMAVINGLVVGLAQDADAGFGLDAGTASALLLTPYALVGWLVGPFAGRLAPQIGYLKVLRTGLAGSVAAVLLMAVIGTHSLPMLVITTVLVGVTYAGMANTMLNGLAIVLSPSDTPGFLPGIISGAFNLGAGLSFALLPVVQVYGSPTGSTSTAGYTGGMLLGAVITAGALAASLLIPKPAGAEVTGPPTRRDVEARSGARR